MKFWTIIVCVGLQFATCSCTVGLYLENCLSESQLDIEEKLRVHTNGPMVLKGILGCSDVMGTIRAVETVSGDSKGIFVVTTKMAAILNSMVRTRSMLATKIHNTPEVRSRRDSRETPLIRVPKKVIKSNKHNMEIWRESLHHLSNHSAIFEFDNGDTNLLIYDYGPSASKGQKAHGKGRRDRGFGMDSSGVPSSQMPLARERRDNHEIWINPKSVEKSRSNDVTNVLSQGFYRIGVVEYPPFMMYDVSIDGTVQNPKGIIIEIIRALASTLKFNYTLVSQTSHGKISDGQWSGAIASLIENKVDMLAMDLSVTPVRAQHLDFTLPFLQGSQAVVVRRSIDSPTLRQLVFNHLRPFHWSIWLVMGACWLVASALLVTSEKPRSGKGVLFIREGRKNVRHEDRSPERRDTWWSIVFQILGLFCQQGCAMSPKRPSSRVILFSACLAALVCYNFYTSVFISFTTVAKTSSTMDTLADVLRDRSYQVGFVKNTGERVEEMFKNSEVPAYQLAWTRMQMTDRTYVDDVEEGMTRTFQEKFAFIAEVHALEWFTIKNCSFKLLQERILNEGYSFALPKNSNDTRIFSKYLKLIVENGLVTRLRSSVMPSLTPDFCDDSGSLEAVGLDRTAGLFLCLTLGCGIAFVSLCLEKLAQEQSGRVNKMAVIRVLSKASKGTEDIEDQQGRDKY